MIEYPNFLPPPLLKSAKLNQQSNTVRTEMDAGVARVRQVDHSPIYVYNMEVNLSADNLSLWHAWHSREAGSGAVWFNIDLITGDSLRTKTARFIGTYTSSPLSDQLWKIKFSLEILDVDSISDHTLHVALGLTILLTNMEKLRDLSNENIKLAFIKIYQNVH